MQKAKNILCECPCGSTKFYLKKLPFVRFYCHCEICQKLYNSAYNDVVVIKSKNVVLKQNGVQFKKYRKPPALDRGICEQCKKPVAGFFRGIPGLRLAFINADNILDKSSLPRPLGHIFYHRKKEYVEDELPKFSGYWRSQIKVCQWIMTKLLVT